MSGSIHGRDAQLDKYLSWIRDNELRQATSAFLEDYFTTMTKLAKSAEPANLVAQAAKDMMASKHGALMDQAEQIDRSHWGASPSEDEKVYPALRSFMEVLHRMHEVAPSLLVQVRSEANL